MHGRAAGSPARPTSRTRLSVTSWFVTVWFSAALLGACGGSDEAAADSVGARPVTVHRLEVTSPVLDELLPGSVEPYRRTQLAFEVSGRLEYVLDVGVDVEGPLLGAGDELLLDEAGAPVQAGDVIAALDTFRFEQRLTELEKNLEAERQGLLAQELDLEGPAAFRVEAARAQAESAQLAVEVAREDITSARNTLDLARSNLERNRALNESGSVSDALLEESETEFDLAVSTLEQARKVVDDRVQSALAAEASVKESEAAIAIQAAQIKRTEALVAQLEVALVQAERDLADCVLRAPFDGRITAVSTSDGSFVSAGSPVAELTLLQPVEVRVSVSAELERGLVLGQRAWVFDRTDARPSSLDSGLEATVFELGGVADPATRTFQVGFLARNRLRSTEGRDSELPAAPGLAPIFTDPLGVDPESPLFVLEECLLLEGDAAFVLVPEGMNGRPDLATLQSALRPRLVEVELGPGYRKIANWRARELLAPDGLARGTYVLREPSREHLDGVVLDHRSWTLRPGDVVWVALDRGDAPAGFYVPMHAVVESDGVKSVFVVTDGVAERVEVELGESSGEQVRILSDALRDGDSIVELGVHFLLDGDAVTVTSSSAP